MTETVAEWLTAQVSPEDKRQVRIAAAIEGISISEFIRRSALTRAAKLVPETLAGSPNNGMRCPQCGSTSVKESDNLHSEWGCLNCGWRGDGSELAGREGDPHV